MTGASIARFRLVVLALSLDGCMVAASERLASGPDRSNRPRSRAREYWCDREGLPRILRQSATRAPFVLAERLLESRRARRSRSSLSRGIDEPADAVFQQGSVEVQ
jgi:hypothetical protein